MNRADLMVDLAEQSKKLGAKKQIVKLQTTNHLMAQPLMSFLIVPVISRALFVPRNCLFCNFKCISVGTILNKFSHEAVTIYIICIQTQQELKTSSM